MNLTKKTTIVLLVITIALSVLTIYQFNKIKELIVIQNLYIKKMDNVFLYLLKSNDATMDITTTLKSLGDPDSKRELWQDLELIKKADRDLNAWEQEIVQIIAVADEKNVSLGEYQSVDYDYDNGTTKMITSSDRLVELSNKVVGNKLGNIIVTLLYFVDPPRLTPETKDYFRKISVEFENFSNEINSFKNSNMYFDERDLPNLKKTTLSMIQNRLEEIDSLSSDFLKILEPRIITPNNN